MLKGYDLSAYQAGLDPRAVPGDFVIIKATGGDGYVNPAWRGQLAAAKAAGRLVGIYHFARDGYTQATAASEAAWFVSQAGDVLDGTVLAVLDWEGDNAADVGYAKAWLDAVADRTGVKPIIYMSFATINAADWSPVANADYGLWEAAYVLGEQRIDGYNLPAGLADIPYWSTRAMWQFTSTGYLPGWPNALDLDVFYGDAATWGAYAAKSGVVAPQATSTTPIQEDDLTPEQAAQLAYIASPKFKIDLWTAPGAEADARRKAEDEIARAVHTYAVPHFDPVTGKDDGRGTNLATMVGYRDLQDVATRNHVDSAVKGVSVTLTPADVDAIAARVAAAVPGHDTAAVAAAVATELANRLKGA